MLQGKNTVLVVAIYLATGSSTFRASLSSLAAFALNRRSASCSENTDSSKEEPDCRALTLLVCRQNDDYKMMKTALLTNDTANLSLNNSVHMTLSSNVTVTQTVRLH